MQSPAHPTSAGQPGQGPGQVILVRQGNGLTVTADGHGPPCHEVVSLLHGQLSYDHKRLLYGAEARDPSTGQKRRSEVTQRRLYSVDPVGRLYTHFGFLRRIDRTLRRSGYKVYIHD